MKAATGLADLARLFHRLPAEHHAAQAARLGFRAPDRPAPLGDRVPAAPAAIVTEHATPPDTAEHETRVPFWRIEATVEPKPPSADEVEAPAEPGLTWAEIESPGSRLTAVPPSPPLETWSTLGSRLRSALQGSVASREPDVAALVRSWAHGDWVRRIPRLARRTWATAVTIWVDRSERLIPFWSDQDDVCGQLARVCGPGALAIRDLDDNLQAVTWQRHGDLVGRRRPNAAAPLLVLGDLGCYGGDGDRARWATTGRRLRREGVAILALVPCSPNDPRWDRDLARAWSAVPWERRGGRRDALTGEQRAHGLLRLIAPTFLAQPGLVRALRKLLPAAQADASTEVDAWHHRDVLARDVIGLVLRESASERLRAEFASLSSSLQAEVASIIDRWHRALPPELLHAETLAWLSWSTASTAKPPGDLERAKAFAGRVTVTGREVGGHDVEPGLAREYGGRLLGAVGGALYTEVPALKKLWTVTRAHLPGERRPATITARDMIMPGPARRKACWWAVYQRGDMLVMLPAATGAWPGWPSRGPGSPVATFAAEEPKVWVRRGNQQTADPTPLEAGAAIQLIPGERLSLDTDQGGEIMLAVWERPAWAVAAGRDRYGLWAAFEVGGVEQRVRWIPPGRFLMGSPEGEAGRQGDEGPQRWVTLTRGYWLGETPVTQALWTAVMGKNPSQFRSDDRPVEHVSWDDCRAFLARLNRALDGFASRLPTEAEWERACRAGTTTATWMGDLTLRGENDAPELDAIAWYGGNSGVDYELVNGIGSSGWPGKQYLHIKAGVHPVGRKSTNPYGLCDMLGNVFEWCQDAAESPSPAGYAAKDVVDPLATQGLYRVYRGGAWDSTARRVRAASRLANERRCRDVYLGFRLAGGPDAAPPLSGEPRTGDSRGAGRASARASAPEATTPRRKKPPVRSARKKKGG